MAWCPHCKLDRPIQRQTFQGKCQFCGRLQSLSHKEGCRGPVVGALDVCTYCNTPIFAKALTESEYEDRVKEESKVEKDKGDCFIVTATVGDAAHPVVCDMRRFRDEMLRGNRVGSRFIEWYYEHGPGMAERMRESPLRRSLCYVFVVAPAHAGVRALLVARDFWQTRVARKKF